jgi:hypothetical protein
VFALLVFITVPRDDTPDRRTMSDCFSSLNGESFVKKIVD